MSGRHPPGTPGEDLELPGYGPAVLLTQGGYSHIYRVHQPQFDRSVAVKVLAFALTDYKAQRRFQRECRLAGRLSAHPNIVTVHDAGIAPDGRPYITMEYFPAGSLADRIHRDGPFKVSDALRIGIACAGALETAHRAGVIHRDVKPANVLLTSYGQPALADFGLSVLAERQAVTTGADALTPYHAPPEMLERSAATTRSDVYSLASTVYTMLAGRAPHQGAGTSDSPSPTVGELLLSILQHDVPPIDQPGIPPSLEDALAGALARDPAERTPTALAFAHALQEVQLQLGYEVTDPIVIDVDTGASGREGAGAAGAAGADGSSGAPSPSLSPSPWPGGPASPTAAAAGNGIAGDRDHLDADGPGLVVGRLDPAGRDVPGAHGARHGSDDLDGPGGLDDPDLVPGLADDLHQDLGEVTVERSATPAPIPRPLTRLDHHRPRRDWRVLAAAGVLVVAGLATAVAVQSGGGGGQPDGVSGGDAGQAGAGEGRPDAAGGDGRGDDGEARPDAAGGDGRGDDGEAGPGGSGAEAAPGSPGSAGPAGPSGGDGNRDGSGGEPGGGGAEPRALTASESEAGVQLEWSGDEEARHVVLVLSETERPRLRDPVDGLSDLVTAPELRAGDGYCFAVARVDAIADIPVGETIESAFSRLACIRGASGSTVQTD
jgi:serine/threonine protein kinase